MPILLPIRLLLLTLLLAGASSSLAQSFEIPPVGSDDTFNVATWNVEHFGVSGSGPSNVELQFQNVLSTIQQANVHLWALQELNDEDVFDDLVSALGDGWAGIWQPDQTSFSVGYGFVYRTDVVEPDLVLPILDEHAYQFAYRPPLLMRVNIETPNGSLGGARVITAHMKCCGGFEDWQRRTQAATALKSYSDNLIAANFPLLILGDLNDELRRSISSNRTSPYKIFLDDDRYHFGTLALEDAGVNTYCGNAGCTSGSTLDHVLIGSTLFDAYEENSTARYDALLNNIPNYVNTTSDHLPVYSRFDLSKPSSTHDGGRPEGFSMSAAFPNPFHDRTSVVYTVGEVSTVRVEVFDALGRRVAAVNDGTRAPGEYEVSVSGAGLPPGLYLIRLTASGPSGDQSSTRRVVRVV